jgi:hypothetical protein
VICGVPARWRDLGFLPECRIAANDVKGQKQSFGRTASLTGMVVNGSLVIRHTDKAARSLCPTSLPRYGGSSYSEEPGMEIL